MPGTVLLFGHADSADTVNQFLRDLAQGFRDLEQPCLLTMLDGRTPLALDPAVIRQSGSFAVDINAKIDTGDFPKLSLIVDHPVSHPRLLAPGARTVLGLIDREHCRIGDYLRAPAVFIPHGGPPPDVIAASPRDIDVLFVGNLLGEAIPRTPMEARAVEIGRGIALSCTDPFSAVLAEFGRLDPLEIKPLLDLATNESQRLARLAALRSIRAARIHVVGYVPDDLVEQMPDGAILHGFDRSFFQGRDLMHRAKVVINVTQKFPAGSHERIWYGMAAGCAVVTNRSSFLAEDFVHGESILFYDDPRQVGDLVEIALGGDQARAMAAAALPAYEAGHTWTERAERIMVAMIGRT
ncbi:hypothetical protein CU669_07905 [Paramagnetospirillum kuznetsovii]|uniref:Spore protein YkvP/CgeB glycosyl transferase-like domain-containing protein n=1 Tax=Paramagnetospirillum kuznetsovii TaxID=2053833 RepID=A0A364NZV6_9PROT|nr:glycosyltransferase [Paramagnetospirillum kuznetsovii]RAU22596.1 hypothetical protein CU669_07905 [Paramagnetospirillum kuznetsovii]